jgi:hypothetical protein
MLDRFAIGGSDSKYDRGQYAPLPERLHHVWLGDTAFVRIHLDHDDVSRYNFLHEIDPATGMNALHIAVGRNNLEMARLLIEAGIKIIPDKEGRMPSLIAGLCRVSDELADYIYEAESRAPQIEAPEGV